MLSDLVKGVMVLADAEEVLKCPALARPCNVPLFIGEGSASGLAREQYVHLLQWARGLGTPRAVPSIVAPGLQWVVALGCDSGAWSPWDICCVEGNCPSPYPSAGIPCGVTKRSNLALGHWWC